MTKFRVGEKVRLKSDPQFAMHVTRHAENGNEVCVWLNSNGKPQDGEFPEDSLDVLLSAVVRRSELTDDDFFTRPAF